MPDALQLQFLLLFEGYETREAARQDVFEYIEMFYNAKRKHTNNRMLSPVGFENRKQKLNEVGV